MIQPGNGTVLYNKDNLHLACVARSESVNYKINLPINLEVCSSDINYNLNDNEINIDCDIGNPL